MVLGSIVLALVIELFLAATVMVVAVAAAATFLVVWGVVSQQQEISQDLDAAVTKL